MIYNGSCQSCSVVPGYYLDTSKACREICGDGILFVLACDDGNKLDGDGCSSNCNVETGWSCSGGSSNSSSKCKVVTQVVMKLVDVEKVQGKNQVMFYFLFNIPLRLSN